MEPVLALTVPNGKRVLHPAKLVPPVDATKRLVSIEANRLPRNPLLKFFKIFFGDGF